MDWKGIKEVFLDDYPDAVIRDNTKKLALIGIMYKLAHPVSDVGCANCLRDSLRKLKHLYEVEMANQEQKNIYILRPVRFGFEGKLIDEDTITDDLARKILSKRPDLSRQFYSLPDGWPNDLDQNKQAEKPVKTSKKAKSPEKSE